MLSLAAKTGHPASMGCGATAGRAYDGGGMAGPSAPVRVMLVEDDDETRERFAALLSRDERTCVVESVGTGREALARVPAVHPDVLLVDLGLPDMHGTQVIRHTLRLLPECDVMVISMFGDEGNVLASIEAGACGYVLKDVDAEALVARVLEVRGGGAPMSPGVARMVLARMRGGAPPAPAPGGLTGREVEVLQLLARGYSYAEASARIGISVHTVGTHIKNTYRKLAVHSAAAAVMRAAELNLLRRK
jgi:DNA-binding NarL/FixJ family response regulator